MIGEATYANVQTDLDKKKVELLTGEEVIHMLEDQAFVAGWDALYRSCPWSTVFQSPEFVLTWYKLYENSYLPILIKQEAEGELTGLLTLALPHRKSGGRKFIVGAGHFEADYQTWLAQPHNGDTFISAALKALAKKFPSTDLMLRHLPVNTPVEWTKSEPQWKQSCILYPLTRPLVVMSDFSVSRRDRKRVSRLKQIGNFEHLTEEADFKAALDDLAVYYDFRQGAMYNKNPFRDDPVNKEFLLALFRRKLLHVTVLKAGDQTVASVAALISKNKANLGGINFHSPLFANYSPGYVHFLMLSQQFVNEGIESFDLTPGGDPYKDRLATQHDQVHILVTTHSRLYFLKRQLRKMLYRRMTNMGIRTMSVELSLKRQTYFLKERGLLHEIGRRIKAIWQNNQERLYQSMFDLKSITSLTVSKNNLKDLLNYKMQGSHRTRWEFLEDAMRRLEQGEQAYTLADKDTLLFCAWVCNPQKTANTEDATENSILPNKAILLQNIYIHPSGLSKFRDTVASIASDIEKNSNLAQVYLRVDPHDKALLKVLTSSGFQLV